MACFSKQSLQFLTKIFVTDIVKEYASNKKFGRNLQQHFQEQVLLIANQYESESYISVLKKGGGAIKEASDVSTMY